MQRNAAVLARALVVMTMAVSALGLTTRPAHAAVVDSLVREVDRLYRAHSAHARIEMEIVTPHWQRTLSMASWSEGMQRTFIRITAPAREKNAATLRVGSEMWNYLPKANKVIKVPPSMMMGSWMGSDFTNDDLVKESSLSDDYTYRFIDVDSAADRIYYIDCVPHEDLAVVWSHIVMAVSKTDHVPIWEKYYDEKNALMRVMTYGNVQRIGDRQIPLTLEMIPQRKEGHRTIIRYLELQFDVDLDPDIFSLQNLHASP
jgi:outer membrane lipoprotein-sorting protein